MIDDLAVIRSVKAFLVNNVVSEYHGNDGRPGLKKPPQDGNPDSEFVLVPPAIYDGWIPPKNYLQEYGYDVPSILVMSDGGQDNIDSIVQIRLAFAVYDPGKSIYTGNELNTSLNVQGYYDLLNLITFTRIKLSDRRLTAGVLPINYDFEWKLYEEQKYPYWHGWMKFTCLIISMNQINNNL